MVSEHCTRDVIVCEPTETLAEAALRMRQSHVGDLVVVEAADRLVPIGMLTDRDIVVGPVAQAADKIVTLTVRDVMTCPAVTVQETEALGTALTKMSQHGVRRVPVVDITGRLTGVLAVDDILGHLKEHLGKLVHLIARQAQREVDQRPY